MQQFIKNSQIFKTILIASSITAGSMCYAEEVELQSCSWVMTDTVSQCYNMDDVYSAQYYPLTVTLATPSSTGVLTITSLSYGETFENMQEAGECGDAEYAIVCDNDANWLVMSINQGTGEPEMAYSQDYIDAGMYPTDESVTCELYAYFADYSPYDTSSPDDAQVFAHLTITLDFNIV